MIFEIHQILHLLPLMGPQ